jgi:hypothetical protein
MAIYRLLRKGVFEPDDVRLLATVYEKILGAVVGGQRSFETNTRARVMGFYLGASSVT